MLVRGDAAAGAAALRAERLALGGAAVRGGAAGLPGRGARAALRTRAGAACGDRRGRLVWWPWIRLWRFAAQFASRKGRRRLRRRVSWRLLALIGFGPWVYPFVAAQLYDELTQFVRGRVEVRGSVEPVTDVAVVLVPLTVLGPDGEPVWMWPDVDGWFSMDALPRVPGSAACMPSTC